MERQVLMFGTKLWGNSGVSGAMIGQHWGILGNNQRSGFTCYFTTGSSGYGFYRRRK